MRIRKNARRVVPEGTPPRTSFLVCKLNRSPWDDPFHSQYFRDDDSDESFPLKGPLSKKCPASDSIPKVEETTEVTFEYMGPPLPPSPVVSLEKEGEAIEVHQVARQPEVKQAGSHLRKRLRAAPSKKVVRAPPKKPPPRPPLPTPACSKKKMGRPKKQRPSTRVAAGAANCKFSDYYYYTGYGFGGSSSSKRRSENKLSSNNTNNNSNNSSVVNVVENGDRDCKNAKDFDSTSYVNLITSEEDISDDGRDKNFDCKEKNKVVPVVGERADDEKLDHNDKYYWVPQKKHRKPIKARSLKSLM